MLKIGEFSRLCHVTVKTLRYYDEMGLLQPVHVDEFTGYRYYAVGQLPSLYRILALKDLGFTLEQIASCLTEGVSAEQLQEILHKKQAEISERMEREQALLARMAARLQLIEQEGVMSNYEVVIKRVEPLQVASIREILPTYPAIGGLLHEVYEYLESKGIRPTGPCAAIWHDTEYKESEVDGEGCFPVEGAVPGNERIKISTLPAVETMASLIHHGSYQGLRQAYLAFLAWIETNGYQCVGPNREIYLQGGEEQDNESYVTELQFPVARR